MRFSTTVFNRPWRIDDRADRNEQVAARENRLTETGQRAIEGLQSRAHRLEMHHRKDGHEIDDRRQGSRLGHVPVADAEMADNGTGTTRPSLAGTSDTDGTSNIRGVAQTTVSFTT